MEETPTAEYEEVDTEGFPDFAGRLRLRLVKSDLEHLAWDESLVDPATIIANKVYKTTGDVEGALVAALIEVGKQLVWKGRGLEFILEE